MPIQISEIKAYCDLCGLDDPIIRYDLMTMVQAMDEEWLKIHDEDRKRRERASVRASPSRR